MVKAVHFEAGTEILDDVDQGSEPAIRPRLEIDTKEEAKTENDE